LPVDYDYSAAVQFELSQFADFSDQTFLWILSDQWSIYLVQEPDRQSNGPLHGSSEFLRPGPRLWKSYTRPSSCGDHELHIRTAVVQNSRGFCREDSRWMASFGNYHTQHRTAIYSYNFQLRCCRSGQQSCRDCRQSPQRPM